MSFFLFSSFLFYLEFLVLLFMFFVNMRIIGIEYFDILNKLFLVSKRIISRVIPHGLHYRRNLESPMSLTSLKDR